MLIIEYITGNTDWSAIIAAGATIALAVATFITVRLMKNQIDEKRKENKRDEAMSIIDEVANKGILTMANIMQDKDYRYTDQYIEEVRKLLFNKYNYSIDEDKINKMFDLYFLMQDKVMNKSLGQDQENNILIFADNLYQYFDKLRKEATNSCIKDSVFLKSVKEQQDKILRNDKT
ncbi:MAG: hypothetical protein Q7U71_01775 [bacterium]|nr:hypothetical protein [bacterium]